MNKSKGKAKRQPEINLSEKPKIMQGMLAHIRDGALREMGKKLFYWLINQFDDNDPPGGSGPIGYDYSMTEA